MADTVRLAIFDFDDTMRRGDSIAALIRYARRHGRIRLWQLPRILLVTLLYLVGVLHENYAKASALHFMKGMPLAEQEAFFSAFAHDVLLPQIYPEARAEIEMHAAQGFAVLIVSASPDCYMRYLSPALPVAAILATPVDADGNVGANCKGAEKLKRIEACAQAQGVAIDWENSHGYGDSVYDTHYLRKVGSPVAVNGHRDLLDAMPGIHKVTWGESARKEKT